MLKKILFLGTLLSCFLFFFPTHVNAQKWKKKKPNILYARNKQKNTTPIFVGIGTSAPTAQFHTTGSVRFEALANNSVLNNVVVIDNNGNLFWKDISNLSAANAWNMIGNVATATNFLGTTNNEDLRIRTNNLQRAVITSTGSLGLGVSAPTAQLHTNGTVRFQSLINGTGNPLVTDANGNIFVGTNPVLNAWNLIGNSPTATDFLGTTNNEDLRIRTNNLQRAVITNSGSFGLGVSAPTAQLHTNGTVRFQGLANGTGNALVTDGNGNVFVGSPIPNSWNLTGNTGTTPANNFLGTTDNNRLVFRTNNTEKMTILADGKVGINIANPTAQMVINSSIPDNHLNIQGEAPSVRFQGSLGANSAAGIGYATLNNNYVLGSLPGDLIVQTLGATANLIFGTTGGGTGNGAERARINASGFFGIATQSPTAVLHTNGTVRHQNLQTGTGNVLVIDANGNVFKSTATARLEGREEDIDVMKKEMNQLKKEIAELKSLLNSMRGGSINIGLNEENAILFQNTPNPFSNTTTIRYYLPANFTKASLEISDLQGKLLKTYPLTGNGKQSAVINANELAAGTYLYSLIVDGKRIDSKKMVLTQ